MQSIRIYKRDFKKLKTVRSIHAGKYFSMVFALLSLFCSSYAIPSELIDLYLPAIFHGDKSSKRNKVVGVGAARAAQAMDPNSTVKAPMIFVPISGTPPPTKMPEPRPKYNCKTACPEIKVN